MPRRAFIREEWTERRPKAYLMDSRDGGMPKVWLMIIGKRNETRKEACEGHRWGAGGHRGQKMPLLRPSIMLYGGTSIWCGGGGG
jgi:hypothetical protein